MDKKTHGFISLGFAFSAFSTQVCRASDLSLNEVVGSSKDKRIRLNQSQFDHSVVRGMDLVGGLTLDQWPNHIRSFLANDLIKVDLKNTSKGDFSKTPKFSYGFSLNGIPLCEYEVNVHMIPDQKPYVIGELPPNASLIAPTAWPVDKDALDLVINSLGDAGYWDEFKTIDQSKCYVIRGDEFQAAWKMTVGAGPYNFAAIASDTEVYSLEARFFEATGRATVYPNNVLDSEMKSFDLINLKDGNKLESDTFKAIVDEKSTLPLAQGTNNEFKFSAGTNEFDQTSVFVNATRTLAWFQSMGYSQFGDYPIKLVVHAVLQDDINNALYSPALNTSSTIFIGDGDGKTLKNLATDGDVVGHEFGHHVVFRHLTSTQGESLVIHEGLADFFNFSRTGNACLGESICPKGSPIKCAVEAQCLRTGKNTFKYGSANLPTEAHMKSQFISGMLWDLTELDGIDNTLVVKLTLYAVDLLASNSDYHDLVLGLLHADRALSSGANCPKIYARAVERGLGSAISNFGCSDATLPGIVETSTGSTLGTGEKTGTTKTGGSQICGVVSGTGRPVVAMLIVLPMLVMLLPRRRDRKV